ncbi:MAG: energy-coupling factor transporter transmembrane protein EcfT [Rhodobacteraceae bacterium]|nr:energy-coupling factor transporter transmembrane protein EcfT [Paracoccaceae bacterium]
MISLTSPVETPFHRWPAGLKLAGLSAATFLMFLTDDPWLLLAALGGVVAAYAIGGWRFLAAGLRLLRPVWVFVVVVAAWHLYTADLVGGSAVVLRLLAAVGMANLVTMTTRLSDMIAVIRLLLAPLRRIGLSTGALEIAVALVIRFVPVLAQKGGNLAEAWRARSPRRAGWRIVAPLALMALDDADHVAEALRARGGVQ